MKEEVFKCKNCGNPLDLSNAANGVIGCEYCHSIFTVPKKEASPAALSFLRQGEHDLDTCNFDDAYLAYKKAAEYDATEPEAYWGMALAEFKVQYVKDTKENRLQPVCHKFTDKKLTQNRNYASALKFATQKQKEEYEKKAQAIDYIRSEFLKLKQSGLDYDCFICVKVSRIDDEQTDIKKKKWTDDAYDADAIYDLLKRNGYTPFFSEREIKGRSGTDYEAMILYALYTSETMLVVCRNEEYLQTPWVKNEYIRFKELVNNEEKENDSLTIIYNGIPIEKLPGFYGKIQGIDYSRRQADVDILKFVENHTPLARAKREEEKRRNEAQFDELKRKMEEQQKFNEKLLQDFNNNNKNFVAGEVSDIRDLLTRANQELEVKEIHKAKNLFETVLSLAPENAAAWWGLFLCECGVGNANGIFNELNLEKVQIICNSYNLKRALQYADTEFRGKVLAFRAEAKKRIAALEAEKALDLSHKQAEFDKLRKKLVKRRVLGNVILGSIFLIFFIIDLIMEDVSAVGSIVSVCTIGFIGVNVFVTRKNRKSKEEIANIKPELDKLNSEVSAIKKLVQYSEFLRV